MSSEELIRESRRHPKIDDRGMMDVPFLVLVLLLVAIGLLMMFSASYVHGPIMKPAIPSTFLSGRPALPAPWAWPPCSAPAGSAVTSGRSWPR